MTTKSSRSQTQELLTRGVEQVLPNAASLAKKMADGPITVYLGIDPTGSLLTLGHSVVLRKLQQFADAGHHVILLIGNGTVRIGDPTGRDSTRPVLTDTQIADNFKTWKKQAQTILDFDKIEIRYNGDWLDKLTYADIVKLLAQTTVQQLIERDMFQDRIKKELPIFGHEILYPLLQGYDSVAMDVDLEIGGSDQLFNMMMGRQLQKTYHDKEKWVLTTPIINGTDGRKMSKSYNNFVALTEKAEDMYGKLMRVADEQIIPYFTLLTDVPLSQVLTMKSAMAAGENPMLFKKQLALQITSMYHSKEAAARAQTIFESGVQQKTLPTNAPSMTPSKSAMPLLQLLSECQTTHSNSELKRLITQKAITLYPTETVITDPQEVVDTTTLTGIRMGKRTYVKVLQTKTQ